MKLVTGGAYQGKLKYAMTTYHITDGWIDGRCCEPSQLDGCRGIHHFHEYIRRMLDADFEGASENLLDSGTFHFAGDDLTALEDEAEMFADWLVRRRPEIVIVSDELGYGIVPVEKRDRLWRETVGRICTCLAARSDEVVRVVCGIGTRLK